MNPIEEQKQNCAYQFRKAVKERRVKKPGHCSRCMQLTPSKKLHAHHDDYSKPLSVDWLCWKCHRQLHAMMRWYRLVCEWAFDCFKKQIDPAIGTLPAMNPKTGMPLKTTIFKYWKAHYRKK